MLTDGQSIVSGGLYFIAIFNDSLRCVHSLSVLPYVHTKDPLISFSNLPLTTGGQYKPTKTPPTCNMLPLLPHFLPI